LAAFLHLRSLALLLGLAAPLSAIVVGYDPTSPTFGNPNSSTYVVSYGNSIDAGVDLSGEVLVGSSDGTCTGSLLADGQSILLAAHCLDPSATPGGILNGTVSIYFDQGCGSNFYCGAYTVSDVANFFIDPAYLADNGAMCDAPGVPGTQIACASFEGDDLAVIRLNQQAPATSARYSLYAGDPAAALSATIELAGAGYTGEGCFDGNWDGANCNPASGSPDPYAPEISAVMRQGQNQYVGTCSGCTNVLQSQFNPNSTLANQVFVAGGDSGGGSFYNGQLVGVHDFTDCDTSACAITGNSYFDDTYVGGANAAWIESVEVATPEPAPAALLAMGLAAGALMWRRKARSAGPVR
jgi:hypothetical protein